MSDINNQISVDILQQSGRFKILSKNKEYKSFKGLACGHSRNVLYDVGGFLYTDKHTFIIDGKEVFADSIGTKTNKKNKVFEILHVEDTHSYMSNDKLNKNCLILDEFAFLGGTLADEFISSVFPTISSAKIKANSKIIIISTPNGMNAFYRIFHKAQVGSNDFIPFKIDWRTIPRSKSNEEFKKNQVNTIGEAKFRQEYMCVGGDTMITLKNEETGEIINISIEEAENLLKDIIESDD